VAGFFRRGFSLLTRQRPDFVGINYYTRAVVRHDAARIPTRATPVRQPAGFIPKTDWEVYEQGLIDTLRWFKQRYGDLPLYITENGAAFADPPVPAGEVLDDPMRVDYLRRHLRALHRAIEDGANVRGYYAWSLLDNLEWSLGLPNASACITLTSPRSDARPRPARVSMRA